jgi:hypothetical protein
LLPGRKKLATDKMLGPLQIPLLVTVDPDESPSAQIHSDLEVVVRLGFFNDVPGKSARAVIRYRPTKTLGKKLKSVELYPKHEPRLISSAEAVQQRVRES